ncbi:WxL domain-containing protein [Levilactobacillus zymae]|uniref:WxL domain-containing protein n=1 Tax=Levilactobacillus zymae TaxID=267363 RepID=UPI0028B3C920|nr:WxL domain-containing protein [Levilactobacillus zymae]MDT6979957.1 WxL domain-containing protein [Levilactobacillus zymae]
MKRWMLILVASLALGAGWPLARASASTDSKTTSAKVTVKSDLSTDPVPPVDPDGSGNPFPGDSNDPNNQGTGSRGHLTLDYISNLKFQQQGITGNFITATATNSRAFVQISDRRGTGKGWSLMLKPEPLVGQQDASTITAATLSLGYAYFLSSGANITKAPSFVAKSALPMNSYSLVARAQDVPGDRQGMGTWLLRLNTKSTDPVSLEVASSAVTAQQTYKGTLSWLLTDTPQ